MKAFHGQKYNDSSGDWLIFNVSFFIFLCFRASWGRRLSASGCSCSSSGIKTTQTNIIEFPGCSPLVLLAFLACPQARLFSLRFGRNFRVRHGNVFGALHQDPLLLLEDPCNAFWPKLLRACLQLRVFLSIARWVTKGSPHAWLYGRILTPESLQTMLLESLLVRWCDYARACIVKSVALVSEKNCRCWVFV